MNNVIPTRSSGILLPIASLPCNYGIGSLGASAYRWIDFLYSAGQRYWQILPLVHLGAGNSPYQSISAFACEPLYLDPDLLRDEGLLQAGEYENIANYKFINYTEVRKHRDKILSLAFSRFHRDARYANYCEENADWLYDYSAYMAAHSGAGEDYFRFLQYKFFEQWSALKQYANSKCINIIGDIPIYVSLDSVDVQSNTNEFQLDRDFKPTFIAGVPPDYFSETGQLWNNPLYNWDIMKSNGYSWWIRRIKSAFKFVDVLRIDHFRGFDSYWAVPFGSSDATSGHWVDGPGIDFINTIKSEIPNARIVAEDLGNITDSVRNLLQESGFPGMKVLQFIFESIGENEPNPFDYAVNSIVYTGTHDNDTILGWANNNHKNIQHALKYLDINDISETPRAMIKFALQSTSQLAIIPLQDWLGLGSEVRLNTPSTENTQNWSWRANNNMLTDKLVSDIYRLTEVTNRV